MSIFPTDLASSVATIAGWLFGFVYAFTGWDATPEKGQLGLAKNPRVKNLAYAAAGLFAIFIADFRAIQDATHFSKGALILVYLFWFIVSAAAFVLAVAAILAFVSKSAELAIIYLHGGFAAYRLERAARQDVRAQASVEFEYEMRKNVMQKTLSVLHFLDGSAQDPKHKNDLIRSILKDIQSLVRFLANSKNVHVNVNYMIAKEYGSATAQEHRSAQFKFLDESEYDYLLVLREYLDLAGSQRDFALPVAKPQHAAAQLPGAPEAYATNTPVFVNTADWRYGKKIPKQVAQQIREYFGDKQFKSFASLPIAFEIGLENKRRSVGVLNIDIGEADFFEKLDDEARKVLVANVTAYTILLGILMKSEIL